MDAIISQTVDTLNQTVNTTMTQTPSTLNQTMDSTLTQTLDTLTQTIGTLNQTLSAKPDYDWLPLMISISTLCVLLLTAWYMRKQFKTQRKQLVAQTNQLETQFVQLKTQNNMLTAQLLKDRIMLGWQTDEPITLDHINNVRFLPDSFIPKEYKDTNTKETGKDAGKKNEKEVELGKYLYLSKVYDYFLYSYIVYDNMKLPDLWGKKWQKQWLRELKKDDVFADVREFQLVGHPDFDAFLKEQMEGNVTTADLSNVCENPNELIKELKEKEIINSDGGVIAIIEDENTKVIISKNDEVTISINKNGEIGNNTIGNEYDSLSNRERKLLIYILIQSKPEKKNEHT